MFRLAAILLASAGLTIAQQQCYYGPGAEFRGPTELVPCLDSGTSACCLLGDICLSGNVCWDYTTGDTYQYGCTDITYSDESCPYKCGWNATKSPWTALEYCAGAPGVEDTWVCHTPESCGCQWNSTYELLVLSPRGCTDMGWDARVALYAPSTLAPYVSLPTSFGGETMYFSGTTISGTSTWISTALKGYTPKSIGPLTTYAKAAPTDTVQLFPNKRPAPSTLPAAVTVNATNTPLPNGVWSGSSSSSSTSSPPPTTAAPSTHTVTATNTAVPPAGLSTGAKAGIGVAAAGGACALVALATLCLVRRRRSQQRASTLTASTSSDYPDKSPRWQPQASPPFVVTPPPPDQQRGSYFYHHPTYGYRGVPAMVHEAGSSPEDEARVRKALRPAELQAEFDVPEMESVSSRTPREGTPAPAYGDGWRTPTPKR